MLNPPQERPQKKSNHELLQRCEMGGGTGGGMRVAHGKKRSNIKYLGGVMQKCIAENPNYHDLLHCALWITHTHARPQLDFG